MLYKTWRVITNPSLIVEGFEAGRRSLRKPSVWTTEGILPLLKPQTDHEPVSHAQPEFVPSRPKPQIETLIETGEQVVSFCAVCCKAAYVDTISYLAGGLFASCTGSMDLILNHEPLFLPAERRCSKWAGIRKTRRYWRRVGRTDDS